MTTSPAAILQVLGFTQISFEVLPTWWLDLNLQRDWGRLMGVFAKVQTVKTHFALHLFGLGGSWWGFG